MQQICLGLIWYITTQDPNRILLFACIPWTISHTSPSCIIQTSPMVWYLDIPHVPASLTIQSEISINFTCKSTIFQDLWWSLMMISPPIYRDFSVIPRRRWRCLAGDSRNCTRPLGGLQRLHFRRWKKNQTLVGSEPHQSWLPSGKHTKNYGKSPFFMENQL